MESNKKLKSHHDKGLTDKNGTAQETWLCNDILVKIILKTHEMYKQKFKVIKVSK